MDYYKKVLEAIYKLLKDTREEFWANWILKDITYWECNNSVEHHISAYGGMGSFNDLIICEINNHNIRKEQEAWVNNLLIILKSLSWYLATKINSDITFDRIKAELKYTSKPIQGTRCLTCGYSELSITNIDDFIAPKIICDGIIDALSKDGLIEFVEDVININLPEIVSEREKILNIISKSNIKFTTLNRWMRPCPKCGSGDTAVYRWSKTKKKNILRKEIERFEPSSDNLELRKLDKKF